MSQLEIDGASGHRARCWLAVEGLSRAPLRRARKAASGFEVDERSALSSDQFCLNRPANVLAAELQARSNAGRRPAFRACQLKPLVGWPCV